VIGGKKVTPAPAAPTARAPHRDVAKTRRESARVTVRAAGELVAAPGTDGWREAGFLLRRLFEQRPFDLTRLVEDFFFEMTQRLVAGRNAPAQAGGETLLPGRQGRGERFETAVGRNRNAAVVTHGFSFTKSPPSDPIKK
jgi:hypothetical protein